MSQYMRMDSIGLYQADEPRRSPPPTFCSQPFQPDQVIVTAKDRSSRWQHINNLDEFFFHVYEYHQRQGLSCIVLSDVLELIQYIFVVSFSTALIGCVDYKLLFQGRQGGNSTKLSLSDVVDCSCERYGSDNCVWRSAWLAVVLVIAATFWLHRLVRFFYRLSIFADIRSFYTTALHVDDGMLKNLTWYEVQEKLCDMQSPYKLCVQKSHLTCLDIYQRILRRKNFLVAMFNKGLLPPKFRVPFFGELTFMTLGLKFNLDLLFFWGPWSPWENYWKLKPDYKRRDRRQMLTDHLKSVILWFGVVNLLLSPLVFAWQVLYSIFTYVELIRREPGALGARKWSLYGRYFFRNYNELDHELENRLCCAYKPASLYMQMFVSNTLEIVAKNVAFVAAAFFSVFFMLSLYDEDVLHVQNVLHILTASGVVIVICHTFIQDENAIFCPEAMMNAVLAYVHCLPNSWRGQAHQAWVRREFSRFYQYRATFVLEELLGPLLCPLALLFWLRPCAGEFVDFFRNFTIEVAGLGDVCSLAQMDVREQGTNGTSNNGQSSARTGLRRQSFDGPLVNGKIELSVLNFLNQNPDWQPPEADLEFLRSLREQADRDAMQIEHQQQQQQQLQQQQFANDGRMLSSNPLTQSYFACLNPNLLASSGAGMGQQYPLRGAGVRRSVAPQTFSSAGQSFFNGITGSATSSLFASASQSLLPTTTTESTAIGHLYNQQQQQQQQIITPALVTSGTGSSSLISSALAPVNFDILYLNELHQRRRQAGGNYGSFQQYVPMFSTTTTATSTRWTSSSGRRGVFNIINSGTQPPPADSSNPHSLV
ncbi:Autophagy-related protein 9A [Trichinella zimbabwensis]|uniref:Autophagy-related protein 9 n=1 Tax=Trichinella zimbabwensis TaxID=268475 RepID=A0A0V1HYD2_9BILA|nr:Autophagy-related protein 9A [Trichinella zimbabwensis]